MKKNGFRLIHEGRDFLKALEFSINNSSEFVIWQSFEGSRVLGKARVTKIKDYEKLIVDFEVQTVHSHHDKDKEYFMYCERDKVLFKGKVIDFNYPFLTLQVSSKKYLEEKRNSKRLVFDDLVVPCLVKTKDGKHKKISRTNEVKLCDISSTGLSFRVPYGKSLLFKEGRSIYITAINSIKLPSALEGTIIRNSVLPSPRPAGDNDELIIVGVKFLKDSKLIKSIMSALGESK